MRIFYLLACNIWGLKCKRIAVLFFLFFVVLASANLIEAQANFQKCKDLDISYEVVKANTNNSIRIDLKGLKKEDLIISLVGPKKLFLENIQESEIKNLNKGTYSLVIVGREETLGFCPKHFQVVIK